MTRDIAERCGVGRLWSARGQRASGVMNTQCVIYVDADTDDKRRGRDGGDHEATQMARRSSGALRHTPGIGGQAERAARKRLGFDRLPHDLERHVPLVRRAVVGDRGIAQQLVEAVGIRGLVRHDSYSFAKSASATRN